MKAARPVRRAGRGNGPDRKAGTAPRLDPYTKLHGPRKWVYYHLYVIIDIFSRYVVGWMVASCELAELAERLIRESVRKQDVDRSQLTLHADRGASMASKSVAHLLDDLGVVKSHSRPHCPNDNPYSEAQFKTLKYRPEFPGCFGSQEDARAFCQRFFSWYCEEHRHSGIGYHTPADIHYGRAQSVREERARTLLGAYGTIPSVSSAVLRNHPGCPTPPGSTLRRCSPRWTRHERHHAGPRGRPAKPYESRFRKGGGLLMERPYSAVELRAAMARMTLREQQQLSDLVETALARTDLATPYLTQIGLTRCAHCGRPLTQLATGRPRRFCKDSCRVNAALRRKLGASEDAPRYQLEDGR